MSRLRPTWLLAVAVLFAAPPASAKTYRPTDENQVLDVLPPGLREAQSGAASKDVGAAQNPQQAGALAAELLEQFQATGETRFLGRMGAVLQPWWRDAAAPVDLVFYRAFLEQHDHQFREAAVDLERVVRLAPDSSAARLLQASVLQTLGEYAAASAACAGLKVTSDVMTTCLLWQRSFTGHVAESVDPMRSILLRSLAPRAADYARTALAEMATRAGDMELAAKLWRRLVAANPRRPFPLMALADLLLDQCREQETLELLRDKDETDAVVLRMALAARRLHRPEAADLERRFVELTRTNGMKGFSRHWREEALFQLDVVGDAKAALALAKSNWDGQKEPLDTRLLARAALAQSDTATLKRLDAWQAALHYEDAQLAAIQRGAPRCAK